MANYTANTDSAKTTKLTSSLQQVYWGRRYAAAGGAVGLEIFTHHVGNNAELQIELEDQSGKSFGKFKDKISGNHFWAEIKVPAGAREALFATAKLPKHNLTMKSPALIVGPAVEITNLKWDRKEARRGDLVKLTADVKGVPDGTEALVEILEHDSDGAHDLITKFPSQVKNKKVEMEWEYEYHEDTDEIPTKAEAQKGYNPPEYFFRVTIGGICADSGILNFKDWMSVELKNQAGEPIPKEDYILHLPDGSTRKGTLDEDGKAEEKDVPPGKVTVEFPNL